MFLTSPDTISAPRSALEATQAHICETHSTTATTIDDGNVHTQTNEDDFEYDAYGNLIIDRNKGITNITYNHLHLPKTVFFGSEDKIEYFYDANGVKVMKKVKIQDEMITRYLDGFQYSNSKIDFFPHAEGYVSNVKSSSQLSDPYFHYVFNYTDHLGNIRLRFTNNPKTDEITILEEDHYYPFGLKHNGYNSRHDMLVEKDTGVELVAVNNLFPETYKYKFGGKELQSEFNLEMYDFGARNYDPAIGRWMNIDPLAEMMRRHSPYNYAFNNPIVFVDPDGMAPSRFGYIGSNSQAYFQDGFFSDGESGNANDTSSSGAESSAAADSGDNSGSSEAQGGDCPPGQECPPPVFDFDSLGGGKSNSSKERNNAASAAEDFTLYDFLNNLVYFANGGLLWELEFDEEPPQLIGATGIVGGTKIVTNVVNNATKSSRFNNPFKISNPNALNRSLPGYTDKVPGSVFRQGRGPLVDFPTHKPALMSFNTQKFSKYSQWAIGTSLSGGSIYYHYKKMMQK